MNDTLRGFLGFIVVVGAVILFWVDLAQKINPKHSDPDQSPAVSVSVEPEENKNIQNKNKNK